MRISALHPPILPARGGLFYVQRVAHLRPSPLNTIERCDASIKETSIMHETIHHVQSRREVGAPVDLLESRHGLGTEQTLTESCVFTKVILSRNLASQTPQPHLRTAITSSRRCGLLDICITKITSRWLFATVPTRL